MSLSQHARIANGKILTGLAASRCNTFRASTWNTVCTLYSGLVCLGSGTDLKQPSLGIPTIITHSRRPTCPNILRVMTVFTADNATSAMGVAVDTATSSLIITVTNWIMMLHYLSNVLVNISTLWLCWHCLGADTVCVLMVMYDYWLCWCVPHVISVTGQGAWQAEYLI